MRGEFDTAAFQAMKAVEVAVREAAGPAASDIGTRLMRKAFDVDKGHLTDKPADASERQALSDLFAGAIGDFIISTLVPGCHQNREGLPNLYFPTTLSPRGGRHPSRLLLRKRRSSSTNPVRANRMMAPPYMFATINRSRRWAMYPARIAGRLLAK